MDFLSACMYKSHFVSSSSLVYVIECSLYSTETCTFQVCTCLYPQFIFLRGHHVSKQYNNACASIDMYDFNIAAFLVLLYRKFMVVFDILSHMYNEIYAIYS